MKRLAGKSALITGAGRGIGRHFAEEYVRQGARVAIADIDIDNAKIAANNQLVELEQELQDEQ